MGEVPTRGELLNTVYTSAFLPLLGKPDKLGLGEAQTLIDTFNAKNKTDLHVRDIFTCTIRSDNNTLVPLAPKEVVLDAARLTLEDCTAALLNPDNAPVREDILTKKRLAQLVLTALS